MILSNLFRLLKPENQALKANCNLLDAYQEAVKQKKIDHDPLQCEIIKRFQDLMTELKIHQSRFRRKKPIKGLYLYGPVGVGKTFLMDLFFERVSEKHKARFHFHHFMQQVDGQLRKMQGQKNPLKHIVSQLRKKTRLLCLDEFLVHDVADALILSELLQAMYKEGIVVVATSNTAPDNLYAEGVHRERFLPAIELIKAHSAVLLLSEDRDYRCGRTPLSHAYCFPLNHETQAILTEEFANISQPVQGHGELLIQNRLIPVVNMAKKAVWFEFDVICNMPRCQLDYLEIANQFHTVFISNVPILRENNTVNIILFIHLVDVLYDRGIRLVISAETSLEALYTQGPMLSEFARTISRLNEMQSVDYLTRHAYREVDGLI